MGRMRFVPLDPVLFADVVAAPAEPLAADPGALLAATAAGHGWAALEEGYPLGAGGVITMGWPGRGLAWMLKTQWAGPRQLAEARRFAKAWFAELEATGAFRRIEASVPARFPQGCRFAMGLGFIREGLMRCYGPLGEDHVLFARVTE